MDFSVLTEEPGSGFHPIHLLKPVFSLLLIKVVLSILQKSAHQCVQRTVISQIQLGSNYQSGAGSSCLIKLLVSESNACFRGGGELAEGSGPCVQGIQTCWEDRDVGSMPLFGISVSVGILVFFYNTEC